MLVGLPSENLAHTLKSLLGRPIQIHEGTFSSATLIPTELLFPQILYANSPNLLNKLSYFTFLRAKLNVRLVFNATPFQQGRYWMCYSPYDDESGRGHTGYSQNLTGYPGVEMDLATGSPAELQVPFISSVSHFKLTDGEGRFGKLVIAPLVELRSGTMPDSCPFTVFAWLSDVDLVFPTKDPVDDLAVALKAQSADAGVKVAGPLETLANVVESVSSSLVGVPLISTVASTVAWVSRFVGASAAYFGLNKETSQTARVHVVNHPARGYTHADGLDDSLVVGLQQDTTLAADFNIFGLEQDEMALATIKQKMCAVRGVAQVNEIAWTTADLPHSQIFSFQNSPSCCQEISATEIAPTTLNYLASMFKLWRGSIKYRVTVAKTAFHTGRLRISYVPSRDGIVTPNTDDTEYCYNWILDLSRTSEMSFEVPYANNVPWMTHLFRQEGDSAWNSSNRTGTLLFEVLTPLKAANSSVAPAVQLTLWHAGGDDLAFSIPCFGQLTPITNDASPNLVAQIFNESTTDGNEGASTTTQLWQSPGMDDLEPEKQCIGDKVINLRSVIKRFGEIYRGRPSPYSHSGQVAASSPLNNGLGNSVLGVVVDPAFFGSRSYTSPQIALASLPVVANVTLPTTAPSTWSITELATTFAVADKFPPWTPLHYISYLFRFYRGGKRYKMLTGQQRALEQTAVSDTAEASEISAGFARVPISVTRQNIQEENGPISGPVFHTGLDDEHFGNFEHLMYSDLKGVAEVEVPYYSRVPLSLVGEGETVLPFDQGPLVSRAKIVFSRGITNNDNQRPHMVSWTGPAPYDQMDNLIQVGWVKESIGSYRLLEAAADDFSFAFLTGAPSCLRL